MQQMTPHTFQYPKVTPAQAPPAPKPHDGHKAAPVQAPASKQPPR